jgi:hypothetical protein
MTKQNIAPDVKIEPVVMLGSRRVEMLPGQHLPPFETAVRMLRRPYIPISEAHYKELYKAAVHFDTDLVWLSDGRQATFGNADNGYALMPLDNSWQWPVYPRPPEKAATSYEIRRRHERSHRATVRAETDRH